MDGWLENHDESDALTEAAQDATTWLNTHIAPEGHYFTFDEGFYLYAEDDEL